VLRDLLNDVAEWVLALCIALVLAFVVVNLYSDYTSASADLTDEANALGAIVLGVELAVADLGQAE
jgi:uncharacterized membrane protein YjfL (UPF0719 family)